jgi:diadenosine tetraphosphate (Ap4A) HIT family hydrolase
MNITLRIPGDLLDIILTDLYRRHEFARERVGFVFCKQVPVPSGHLLLAYKYTPIRDKQYIENQTVGAEFDASAIREAMQLALDEDAAVLHVHFHDHPGRPSMSKTDNREMQALMPCFVNLCPKRVHGALVLSADRATARVWGTNLPPDGTSMTKITSVGARIRFLGGV